MEQHFRAPQPLSNNSTKTWNLWKEEFLIFMKLIGDMEKPNDYKANCLKHLIGPVGIEIISKLSFNHPEDKDNLDILLQKIDEYYNPPRKETEKRYQFFNSPMNTTETIENYIQSLKDKAQQCKFGDLKDSLIIDVIILHANDKVLRKKYLQEDNLNYEKIIEIYKNHKIATLESNSSNANLPPKQRPKANVNLKEKENPCSQQKKPCKKCNNVHPYKQCPAWNYKCKTCGEMHHFEGCCQNLSNQNKVLNKSMNNLTMGKNRRKPANQDKVLNNIPRPF
ncbi:hypothetical protein M0802_007252 [Mischocyttarus mexicanus]|nr:hypothetical protein M0802_007252 [Mischocyttarus mexicanus]